MIWRTTGDLKAGLPICWVVILLSVGCAMPSVAEVVGPPARQGLLTPQEQLWLEAHPVIRLAPSSDYRPVEFLEADDYYSGLTSEYFKLIEQRLGYRFQIVHLSHEQWQTIEPNERGADMVTASAATDRCLKYWNFTAPYLNFPTFIVVRQGVSSGVSLQQLSGSRVAVVQGWALEEYLRVQFPKLLIDSVPDAATGLRKVSFGLVDAFISELPVATSRMEAEGISNLQIAGEAGFVYRLSISIRKDWPELQVIMEKALATITPGERERFFRRWVKLANPPSLVGERLRRIALWSGALVLGGLAGILAWNRALASKIKVRTAELRGELIRGAEAAEALRISEEKFSKAFRSSPDAIFITRWRDGLVLEANAGASRIYDCPLEEIIGKATYGAGWGFVSPLERERAVSILPRDGGRVYDREMRQMRKTGEIFTALVSFETIEINSEPCIVGILRDVTKQRSAEAALRLSEERFAKAFRSSPVAMCITTLDEGRFLDVNDAFLRMNNLPDSKTVIGRTSLELGLWFDNDDRGILAERLFREGRIVNFKRVFRRFSGDLGTGLYSVEVISLDGVTCVIVIINDISALEQAESARQQLLVQLLESEDEERRRIARELHDTTAQHLAAIHMNLSRLSHLVSPELGAGLISDSVSLVAQSVQEIRTLTYLLHPPLLEDLGLVGALSDYVEGFSHRSGVKVELDAGGYYGRLRRDQELALFRVVQESLTNVRRHSTSTSALVRLDRDAEEVRLEVQDSGCGMANQVSLGVGLRGMRERLTQAGGLLSIESDHEGTTILASMPTNESIHPPEPTIP